MYNKAIPTISCLQLCLLSTVFHATNSSQNISSPLYIPYEIIKLLTSSRFNFSAVPTVSCHLLWLPPTTISTSCYYVARFHCHALAIPWNYILRCICETVPGYLKLEEVLQCAFQYTAMCFGCYRHGIVPLLINVAIRCYLKSISCYDEACETACYSSKSNLVWKYSKTWNTLPHWWDRGPKHLVQFSCWGAADKQYFPNFRVYIIIHQYWAGHYDSLSLLPVSLAHNQIPLLADGLWRWGDPDPSMQWQRG